MNLIALINLDIRAGDLSGSLQDIVDSAFMIHGESHSNYSRDPNQNGKIQTSNRGVFQMDFYSGISYWDSETQNTCYSKSLFKTFRLIYSIIFS